ncbi:disease resistance protein [Salix suchowensis]|nr:disease resistance protein [Salix suchowensis]
MEEANQINVEVSRATAAAAEEAPGKGSVDGIMEVQEVTESSGPLQPKSLNGLASAYNSAFRHRHGFKEKSKLEQVVIEVNLDSSKAGYLASKLAAEIEGVESVELGGPDRNLLEVIGEGVDAAHLVTLLRKKFGNAKLISTGPVKEPMKDIMEDEPVLIKEEENEPVLQPPVPPSIPHCLLRISKSAVDTAETTKLNGAMKMETKTNTHSNLSLENAESSCKTKTAEWTLLITSLLLEAISAIFDQLGYALTSMVMAFLALLLSILDLTQKAREKGVSCDGRGLLPCFYRHDFQNREPFGSVVEYFGFAGAVWQCSYTTVGYHYTRQNLDNPIKICLLPFIFALCVLISKLVKSSQHEPLVELKPT